MPEPLTLSVRLRYVASDVEDSGVRTPARRRAIFALWAVVAAVGAGCGGNRDDKPARAAVQGRPDPAHAAAVERDPYLVTCGDLVRQTAHPESAKLVIRAEFALAQDPALRPVVEKETLNRVGRSVYYGLVEECKGQPEEFRPATRTVAGVRDGKYLAARNRPG